METRGATSRDARASHGPTRKAHGFARHTLGIILLLCVVFMWTASNFLASTILADSSFSKPFFVTYVNTSFFIVFLILVIARRSFRLWRRGKLSQVTSWQSFVVYMDAHGRKEDTDGRGVPTFETEGSDEEQSTQRQRLLDGYYDADHQPTGSTAAAGTPPAIASKLGFYETARLSLQFCMLWFLANYFALACLQYTTVGSTTILTSTSGVWTLLFGAFIGVERLTIRKVIGVVASLVGVILISRVDVSSSDEKTPTPTSAEPGKNEGGTLGSFPHKTPAEIALGDAMAAFSAIMYGVYTIVMKKQVGDESRVNMQLFFGLVGFFNVFLLWPGFIIMHLTGLETFTLPPTERIWTIILINSTTSLISDMCWAYAMLLTTPLVVTVGLSLTIPLSLVGQIILQGQYASALYWVGAVLVFVSFMIVNHESKADEIVETKTPPASVAGSRSDDR